MSLSTAFCFRKFFAGKVFKTPQHLQKNFFRAGGSLIILSCEVDFRQDQELTAVAQLYYSDVIPDTDIFADVSFETRFHEFKNIGVVITRGLLQHKIFQTVEKFTISDPRNISIPVCFRAGNEFEFPNFLQSVHLISPGKFRCSLPVC